MSGRELRGTEWPAGCRAPQEESGLSRVEALAGIQVIPLAKMKFTSQVASVQRRQLGTEVSGEAVRTGDRVT